jgi:ABC-type Fe3+ transport system permease subunit/DNA-binding beta-propeller fold protein YncE
MAGARRAQAPCRTDERFMSLTVGLRIARALGWVALAASVFVVIGVLLSAILGGFPPEASAWPGPRQRHCLWNSVWLSTVATLVAAFIAILPAMALTTARSRVFRAALLTLILLPLVTMPASTAYAWMLLSTSRVSWLAALVEAVGWNAPGRQTMQAAWVMACWLWPIPCLTMALAFRHGARSAYQMACLETSPPRAFVHAALPLLRAPLAAAMIVVFLLALTDNTIAPLMNAVNVWSVEMLAQATVAPRSDRPVAFLFAQCWPMLALIALLGVVALPGVRRMADWTEDPDDGTTGGLLASSRRVENPALVLAACLTLLPMAVFVLELSTGRDSLASTAAAVARTLGSSAMATLLVAVFTGLLTIAIALSMMPIRARITVGVAFTRDRRGNRMMNLAAALVLLVALLPPELTGTCLVAFFTRISDPSQWNVYDNTPWPWIAALLCRYAFISLCAARLLDRVVPVSLLEASALDGATALQQLRHARLPYVGRGLLSAGVFTACLCLSEVAVSVLVQPPRFFGGSLAVAVDAQMHYGRNDETVLATLALMTPGILTAVFLALRMSPASVKQRISSPRARCMAFLLAVGVLIPAGCDQVNDDAASVRTIFGATGLGPGEFSYPRAIAVSPVDGRVFVVDKTARIQRFSPDGAYETLWRMPEYDFGKPTGLCVDRQNRVWVADTHYARVIAFDRDGRELFRFGSRGEGPGQFIFPTHVALDRDGYIYVGEYGGDDRISKFSPDRVFVTAFADKSSGPGWVERPTALHFDDQDVLWVADACHHRICRFDRSGRFLSAFGAPGDAPDQFNYPYGLALHPDGSLVIADRGNNRLAGYDRAGRFLRLWGSPGRAKGQLQQPWSVAVGVDGRVYCLDSWNNRVQVIDW